jgi:hypothetical protein
VGSKVFGLLAATAMLWSLAVVPATVPAAASSAPFTDEYANGYLTLCNRNEQPVTSGSLLTVPFVWTAVSSTAAPKGYTRAYLMAYQPLQYVDPGDWSGYQLTDDAAFSNPAHPMAQATNDDAPLEWSVNTFPPHWGGWFELRMYFTSPNLPAFVTPYPVDILHISGNSWSLVDPGPSISCTIGKAVSRESLLLPRSELSSPQSLIVGPAPAKSSGSLGTGSKTGSASSSDARNSRSAVAPASQHSTSEEASPAATNSSSGISGAAIAAIAIAVAIVTGAAAWLVRSRRRRPPAAVVRDG